MTLISRKIVYAFAGALIISVSLSWYVAGKLVEPAQTKIQVPPDFPFVAFHTDSESGSRIAGWHVSAETSRGVVVLLHGIRSNRLAMLDRARFLHRNQYSVVAIDFQAHGESPGNAITLGHLEKFDAIAAVDYAKKIFPNSPVAVIGASMGGAAVLLAPTLNIDALIVESIYTDIRTAVKHRVRQRLGVFHSLPAEILLFQLYLRLGVQEKALSPIDEIRIARYPMLIIAGADDQHTTADDTRALFEAAKEPKELWLIEGVAHVDLHKAAGEKYENRILNFLSTHLDRKSESNDQNSR